MKRTLLGGAIAVTIATTLAFAGAAPAMADAPKTLAAIQAAGAAATSQRIASLNRTIPTVSGNSCITADDQGAILSTLDADLTAMQGLAATIAADTDAATAARHYQSIFDDYRVYGVALAQAHYAAAADCITTTALPALLSAQDKLVRALAGPLAGKSTPDIEAKMADLAAQIATAQANTDGVAAAALAVTTADYNANPAVLSGVQTSVSSAVAAVRLAKQDIQDVTAALK